MEKNTVDGSSENHYINSYNHASAVSCYLMAMCVIKKTLSHKNSGKYQYVQLGSIN